MGSDPRSQPRAPGAGGELRRWRFAVGLVAALLLAGCSEPASPRDAGAADASAPDAGAPDASTPDAGARHDAGVCSPDPGPFDAGAPRRLEILGDPDAGATSEGIFDPSLSSSLDAGLLVLAYSSVDNALFIHTRIATSTDRGQSFAFQSVVNGSPIVPVFTSDLGVCDAGVCGGTLVHETPSLVVDEGDPDPSRRLKIFTHTYFIGVPGGLLYGLGYLSLYTAPGPGGPWAETRLLGWPSSSPLSTQGVTQNLSTDPKLRGVADCLFLTEPAALAHDGVLELAVACVRATSPSDVWIETRLLRSTDHGASFAFVATLLDRADARALGALGPAPQASGPGLFRAKGRTWLSSTPNGPIATGGDGYRGCAMIAFDRLEAGTLERCGGAPVVHRRFDAAPGAFNGACSFDEAAPLAGLLLPRARADLSFGRRFEIFATGVSPVP